jgi:hypothetical protein
MDSAIHLNHVEANEPSENCEIHIGTFSYILNGEQVLAEFYIRTCQDDRERRFNDYNEQLTDEWEQLLTNNAQYISYEEVAPCPL